MSNSSLVNYKLLTSHFGYPTGKTGRGGSKIDKIFVHHMAGNLTVEQCGKVFKNNEASAHYGIDGKGRIGQYVLEENTAWHCANKAYNQRSIGIELANDGGAKDNWHVSDKTIAKCIELIVDICKRNGIKKINYTGNLQGNLCMHCWTASTACPGGYLKTKFRYIADQVNKKLSGTSPAPAEKTELYRVRKSWADSKSQIGAYKVLENAIQVAKEKGLNVYNSTGKAVYESPAKAEIYRVRKSWNDPKSQAGAFKDLNNAKKLADEKGLNVYGSNGKLIYTGKKKVVRPIQDKIIAACITQANYAKGAPYKWISKPTIENSKKGMTCVSYGAVVMQRVGLLKPGQHIWHDGKGYGTGKVTGNTANFDVLYQNNKTLSSLRDTLEEGDLVLCDDNKSGEKGSGGHEFIFSGEWADNGNPLIYDQNSAAYAKNNKPLLRSYSKSHKVLAICRAK